MMRGKKLLEVALVFAILIFVNVLASFFYTAFDLTEDKRFTLAESSQNMVESVDENVYVQVLLDGELAAGFKRLRNSTRDLLGQLNSLNSNIQFEFVDPSDGTLEQINQTRDQLRKIGVVPTRVSIMDGKETVEKYIYPFALVSSGQNQIKVDLLEEQRLGVANELILNNSVSLLEYKICNAIFKISNKDKPNVVFTAGNGEYGGDCGKT